MKDKYIAAALIVLVLAFLAFRVREAHAQNPALTPSVLTIPSGISHTTTCPVPVAGSTFYCWAGDGLWESDNGVVYFRLAGGGVTSVNGKTGAVTIAASTTSTTTLQ